MYIRGEISKRKFQMFPLAAAAIFFQLACFTNASNSTAENVLFHTVFSSTYNPLLPPSPKVDVKVGFHLLTINELDTKRQTLSVSGFFSMVWTDPRLMWSAESHSGTKRMFQTENNMWKPEVIIDNSVNNLNPLHGPYGVIKLRILDSGEVMWKTAGIYVVYCEIDTTFYPFDSQECYLKLTSWSDNTHELNLIHKHPDIDLEDFQENGEWIVLETSTSCGELYDDGEILPQMEFRMHLQRRSAFYVLNVILPIIITCALTPVVFLLPADSGEKASYTLTLLLAQAVVLTIVSDQMPTISKHTSVFGIYLALNLGLSATSILVSVAVLYTYHQNPSRQITNSWKLAAVHVFMRFPRPKEMRRYEASRKNKALQITTSDDGEDVEMEMNEEENTSPIDDEITWMDVSESLDAFSFRVFLITSVVLLVALIAALTVGKNISSD